jgi:hypothetical protein
LIPDAIEREAESHAQLGFRIDCNAKHLIQHDTEPTGRIARGIDSKK